MRLYHGSPKVLKVIKPVKESGMRGYGTKKVVLLKRTFMQAALSAIGQTLKGRTAFAVAERNLIVEGEFDPDSGYVYEVNVEDPIKGTKGQFASEEELKPVKKSKVSPEDYRDFIIRVRTKQDVLAWMNKHT